MNEISNKWIGKNTIRPDGADKVTGRAQYSSDTTMPGMIWGHVLRSPHPHARILSINTKKAEELEGVKAVITSKDVVDFPIDTPVILGIQDMRWMCRNVMARNKVLYHGHPLAAVAETTEEQPSESKEDLRARLAAEAKRTGVMQAAPGTEQGKTGWYIDSDGQLTSWLVSESGEWTRMS